MKPYFVFVPNGSCSWELPTLSVAQIPLQQPATDCNRLQVTAHTRGVAVTPHTALTEAWTNPDDLQDFKTCSKTGKKVIWSAGVVALMQPLVALIQPTPFEPQPTPFESQPTPF
jgi:hypothetical protein